MSKAEWKQEKAQKPGTAYARADSHRTQVSIDREGGQALSGGGQGSNHASGGAKVCACCKMSSTDRE